MDSMEEALELAQTFREQRDKALDLLDSWIVEQRAAARQRDEALNLLDEALKMLDQREGHLQFYPTNN